MDDDLHERLLGPVTVNPRENLRFRLKMRDVLTSKNDAIDQNYPFQVFLNYQFDYFDVLQVLSPTQYLKACRRCTNPLNDTVRAFLHYSLLSLSLDGPITCEEFRAAVAFLTTNTASIPAFLRRSVDDLLQDATAAFNEVVDEPPSIGPIPFHDLEVSESHFDFDAIFRCPPPNANERRACGALLEWFDRRDSSPLDYLSEATHNFTDFGFIFDYFRDQRDCFCSFASLILVIGRSSPHGLQLFQRDFWAGGVRSFVDSLVESLAAKYAVFVTAVEIPAGFFGSVLELAADYDVGCEWPILAAVQLGAPDKFVIALTRSYSRSRRLDGNMVKLGIDMLAAAHKNFVLALLQWVDGKVDLAGAVSGFKLTADHLVRAARYFWDLRMLHAFTKIVSGTCEEAVGLSSINANEQREIPTFQDVCIMRMLNDMNAEVTSIKMPLFMPVVCL